MLADGLAYAVDELRPRRAGRRRDADRRHADLAGPAHRRPLRLRRRARRPPRHGRARPPASRCGGCRWSTTTPSGSRARSPTPTTRAATPGGDHRGTVPAASSPASLPWAHLDIAGGRRLPGGRLRVERRPDRLRCPPAPALARAPPAARRRRREGTLTCRSHVHPAGSHRALVPRRMPPEGVEKAARRLRRRHLPRPVHRHGRPALQDLAHARGRVVRGLLRLRHATTRGRRSRSRSRATAAESPGSQIIGSPPVLIEPCTVVAVAEGAEGFAAAASYSG